VFQLAWRGVRHNTGRYIATLIAIMTGVAFFTATGFLSDRVINALEGDAARQYGGIDAAVVVDDTADGGQFAGDLRIGQDIADQIAALPEVAAVGGDLSGSVAFLAPDGSTFADGATGRLWIDDDELNPIDIDEGVAPVAAGEIAVDKGLAGDHDLEVGDQVTILTLAGQFDTTVVGITSFGNTDAQDSGGTVSIPESTAFDWLNAGQAEYQDLYIRGTGDQAALVSAVEPLVPPGFRVQPGDEFLKDKQSEVSGFGRILKTGLQGFALLALFVGGFVIYNTFSVIVAQRLRELAVLAAIGATPKQIKRSLRFEGLVIGLIGSALGVAAGFGLAFVLMVVLKALGVSLPGSGITVSPSVVQQGLIVGTLITFLSVMVPARRAARTEPIEALRQAAVETSPLSRQRVIAAGLLVGLGALGMLVGPAAAIGFGAVALFIGVIVAGPIIAVVGSKVFRPLLSRLGLEGRLAGDNIARNPQRTATTSNALLIGVFLVTLVTVAGTSVKDFAVAKINELSSADYVIESTGGTIDDGLIADLEAVDGVDAVTPFRREAVSVEGDAIVESSASAVPSALSTGDFTALSDIADLELDQGSIDDLGPGQVLLISDVAGTDPIGKSVTMTNSQGGTVDLEVAGVIKFSLDSGIVGNFVDTATFDAFVGETAPTVAFMDIATGAQTDTEDAIDEIVALRPDITLTQGNAFGRIIGQIFDFLINAVNGLLLMSVVVALIGIVNTLSLSILERRRELGLLRVVGMEDKRVRRMVRVESVLISALGTITGVALGVFTGWALIYGIDRLSEAGIAFSFPGGMLALVLVLGTGLGFLASLIPAQRSTRLEVLDAIEAT
jgi:putative ABC transport system permease protein